MNKADQVIIENNTIQIIPFNKNNFLINPEHITDILTQFIPNYIVKDIKYFRVAMTHKSYTKNEYHNNPTINNHTNNYNCLELQDSSYERLEFLGDTVCKALISEYLFKRYPNQDEGFMTRLKIKLENGQMFAKFGRYLGLYKYLIISHQIERKMGRTHEKIIEDIFEAFIGALYLDSGIDMCRIVIIKLLETQVDFAEILFHDDNYKDQLLRFYHKKEWSPPKYIDIKIDGPVHKREFTIGVKDNVGRIVATGTDYLKKKAEQIASKNALIYFGALTE